jgi:hypothetical protein
MLFSLEACDAVNIDELILITTVVLSKDYNLCTECADQPDWLLSSEDSIWPNE